MTATERLRAMLDERGVEYRTHGMTDRTWFDVGGISWFVIERENGRTAVQAEFLTPEQAIEAALGRGECRLIPTRDKPRSKAPTLTCSKCGWWTDRINDRINYCPSCGKRVKA